MDWLSMLTNAKVRDMNEDDLGNIIAIHIVAGKMIITLDTPDEEEDENDPEKESVPELIDFKTLRVAAGRDTDRG